jgi:hypothetical protein
MLSSEIIKPHLQQMAININEVCKIAKIARLENVCTLHLGIKLHSCAVNAESMIEQISHEVT